MADLPEHDRRASEVWDRLALVTDPELDEPVTKLGFVELVTVDDEGGVDIVFRLPTYWCSANFAFLMADDMRRSVMTLPWVRHARPRLQDHMVADEINKGVSRGSSFREALKDFAPGETLEDLREKFQRKAFERRQEVMILALRKAGYDDLSICRMNLESYDQSDFGQEEALYQKPRYREILVERGLASLPGDRAFVTWSGYPIEPRELASHLRRLRTVRINMEFNSALCRGLLGARYLERDGSSVELKRTDAGECVACRGTGCGKRPLAQSPAATAEEGAGVFA
ncbi:iron-sulfur cluster assembly protein [Bradyrhizobium cenepequi]